MELIHKIEDTMKDWFKGLPPLPEGGREGLAKVFPWIALVFGILQLLAAWGLWSLTRTVDVLNTYVNTYYQAATGTTAHIGLSSTDKMVIYVGLLVLLVDAVILLLAFSPLSKRLRRGWDLLFLSALINLVYAVVSIFINGRGFMSFIFSLLASALGFYLLFQVKGKYGSSAHHAAPKHENPAKTE